MPWLTIIVLCPFIGCAEGLRARRSAEWLRARQIDAASQQRDFFQSFDTDATWARDAVHTYDLSLAVLAFLATGRPDDEAVAADIGARLVFAQQHDKVFHDGRLRNVYHCSLTDHDGAAWYWNGPEDAGGNESGDAYGAGTATGPLAWALLAWLSLEERTGQGEFLEAALRGGEWILANCEDDSGVGFSGGRRGWGAGQERLTSKSTEENFAAYAAFSRLNDRTGEVRWHAASVRAAAHLRQMWDASRGCMLAGVEESGRPTRDKAMADVDSLSILAMRDCVPWASALSCARREHMASDAGSRGVDFDDDLDGVWTEGTLQLVLAEEYARAIGCPVDRESRGYRLPHENGALLAASRDGLTTGLDWVYYRVPAVAPAAWAVFLGWRYNPYWGKHF